MARREDRYLVYVVTFLAIILVSSLLIYQNTKSTEMRIVDVSYEVGGQAGFDLNSSLLNFGRLIPGSSGTRKLNITNTYYKDIEVSFYPSKSIDEVIFYDSAKITLSPNSFVEVPFTIKIDKNASYGNYTGYITVKIMK